MDWKASQADQRHPPCLFIMVVLDYYYTSIKPLLKCGIYALI